MECGSTKWNNILFLYEVQINLFKKNDQAPLSHFKNSDTMTKCFSLFLKIPFFNRS